MPNAVYHVSWRGSDILVTTGCADVPKSVFFDLDSFGDIPWASGQGGNPFPSNPVDETAPAPNWLPARDKWSFWRIHIHRPDSMIGGPLDLGCRVAGGA